ncbi:MAG TPA: hypothetical protein VF276_04420 [Chloroflexia bacterium]
MNEVVDNPQPAATREYRLAPEARRTTLVLMLGVLAIAVFAIWSFVALLSGGLQGPEWVSALLMLAILGLSPLVAWGLLAEYNATILTDAAGLTYRTIGGINLTYPWPQVQGLAPAPLGLFTFGDKVRAAGRNAAQSTLAIEREPVTGKDVEIPPAVPEGGAAEALPESEPPRQIVVDPPAPERIANPLARLLYQQSYAGGLPLPMGLQDRPALIDEIAAHRTAATTSQLSV